MSLRAHSRILTVRFANSHVIAKAFKSIAFKYFLTLKAPPTQCQTQMSLKFGSVPMEIFVKTVINLISGQLERISRMLRVFGCFWFN